MRHDCLGVGRTSPPSNARAAAKHPRRILAIATAILVVVAAGVCFFYFVAPYETTDDAFIDGRVVPVAPQISGRVSEVLVRDNQQVHKGDVLMRIDPAEYEARLAVVRADLASAKSFLKQRKAQYAADCTIVQHELTKAKAIDSMARMALANASSYQAPDVTGIPQSEIDDATSQAVIAVEQLEIARARIVAADAQAQLSKANVEVADANVQQAEAAVRQAELNVSRTDIIAPEDGRIIHNITGAGEYVNPGQSLLGIVSNDIWVVANFKETQLEHMRRGQIVTIKMDAYPHHTFAGYVDSIQSGPGARLYTSERESSADKHTKVPQRVPVKIALVGSDHEDFVLGPGMSVNSRVHIK